MILFCVIDLNAVALKSTDQHSCAHWLVQLMRLDTLSLSLVRAGAY